jgi:hypothetical protein
VLVRRLESKKEVAPAEAAVWYVPATTILSLLSSWSTLNSKRSMVKEVTVDVKLTVVLILFVVFPEPVREALTLSDGAEIVGGKGGLPFLKPRALDEAELKVPNRGMIKPSYQIRFLKQKLYMCLRLS